jgi:hypothetical protein
MPEDALPPDPQAVDDTGMRCQECGYNVTGLTDNRCPECGTEFDPDLLQRIAAGEPIPCTPWDTRGGFSGFWQTWWMALVRPRQLATELAPRQDVNRAIAYSIYCFALAGALLVTIGGLVGVLSGDPVRMLVTSLLMVPPLCFAWWSCETVIAALLTCIGAPRGMRHAYHFWRGLTHYTGGSTLLTGAWVGLGLVSMRVWDEAAIILIPLAVIIALCWGWALGSAVDQRTESATRAVLAWLVILICGVGAVILGLTAASSFYFEFYSWP